MVGMGISPVDIWQADGKNLESVNLRKHAQALSPSLLATPLFKAHIWGFPSLHRSTRFPLSGGSKRLLCVPRDLLELNVCAFPLNKNRYAEDLILNAVVQMSDTNGTKC